MKILFIGGTGEISQSCVSQAAAEGHDVTVFNRGRTTTALPPNVKQFVGSVNDDSQYRPLSKEHYDVVCQFLAYELPMATRDAEVFQDNCGQYIFISTASAYLKPPPDYVITEDTPLGNPFWPYSQQKADMESYLQTQHEQGRLNVTIVRPSHTVRTRFPGGIVAGDDWAWRMQNRKPILIQGDGTALWTLTHSDDFAVPFVRLFGNEAAYGEAFHITRHMRAFSWDQIFTEMATALGVEPNIVHVPVDWLVRYDEEWSGPLRGDKMHSVLFDNSKIRRATGHYDCEVGLTEIMRRSAEHYQRRVSAYSPCQKTHDLLDRIASDANKVGP